MKEIFSGAGNNIETGGPEGVRLLDLHTPDDGQETDAELATAASESADAGERERERLAERNRQISRQMEEDEEEARKKKPAADFNSEAGTSGLMDASPETKDDKSGYETPDENGASGLGTAPGMGAAGFGAAAAATGFGAGVHGNFRNEWLSPRVNISNNPGMRWWVDDMLIGTLRQKSDSNIIYIKHGISHRCTMASGKTSQLLQARAQQIAAEMKENPNKHRRFRKYQDVLERLRVTDNYQTAKNWRMQEQTMQGAQASTKAPVGP